MGSTKVNYRVLHESGVATYFHVIDSNLIPFGNFEIAFKWYNEGALTTTSELEMSELIRDPKIMEAYEKFLDEEKRIIAARSRNKMGSGRDNLAGV
jgi:hypothetical protein